MCLQPLLRVCVMHTGQASRTTLLAEGAASVAGDVAESGASFKNEVEAALAIRSLTALQPLLSVCARSTPVHVCLHSIVKQSYVNMYVCPLNTEAKRQLLPAAKSSPNSQLTKAILSRSICMR